MKLREAANTGFKVILFLFIGCAVEINEAKSLHAGRGLLLSILSSLQGLKRDLKMNNLGKRLFFRNVAAFGVVALCFVFLLTNGRVAAATSNEDISIAVIGDSLADGLYAGLKQLSRSHENIKVKKYSKVNTGLVRYDRYDWGNAARKIASKDNSDIFILMFGANDLQTIRESSGRYHFQTDGWLKRYKARIDTILTELKSTGRDVYWVGLPIVGKKNFAKGYKYLNGIYKERAEANGIQYIESWDWFASENGSFQMSGTTSDGKKRTLRAKDKVHFTPVGYHEIGRLVAREIKLVK